MENKVTFVTQILQLHKLYIKKVSKEDSLYNHWSCQSLQFSNGTKTSIQSMTLFTLLQERGSIEMTNTCSEGRSEIPVVKTDSSSLVVDQPHAV